MEPNATYEKGLHVVAQIHVFVCERDTKNLGKSVLVLLQLATKKNGFCFVGGVGSLRPNK